MTTNQKNWQELIRPNKLEVTPGYDPKRIGSVVAEPLERGFGLTLGNALRRVLLSSLQGAAVTSVQIDGVLHEFSSMNGVREDVTDIILNIKEIAVRMSGEGPKRMVLRKQGPGAVTAGDIQTVGDVSILNPDHVLCTLDEGADIRMEFSVNTGKGYVPADRNRPEDAAIGLIPVDSLYSPVKRVSYRVENTREGQVLDYDKLSMQVETDGSLSPEDAVAYAARILQDQLSIFVNFEEPTKPEVHRRGSRARLQSGAPQEGGRAGAIGALGELPEERQHRLHRRPHPEVRGGDAPHPELRPQVAERDQGSAGSDGSAPRYGSRQLAARQHRGAGQAVRGPSLLGSDDRPGLTLRPFVPGPDRRGRHPSANAGCARPHSQRRIAMRHKKQGRRLNRTSSHRMAMMANQAASLIEHEQIVTTVPKAKELRPVHREARDARQARRSARAPECDLEDPQSRWWHKLFATIGPRYKDRNGGYTRILRAGFRYGDNAPIAVIEFVDRDVSAKGAADAARREAEEAKPLTRQRPASPGVQTDKPAAHRAAGLFVSGRRIVGERQPVWRRRPSQVCGVEGATGLWGNTSRAAVLLGESMVGRLGYHPQLEVPFHSSPGRQRERICVVSMRRGTTSHVSSSL